MPHVLLFATGAFLAFAVLLVASWLIPLSLLIRRLARTTPGYYQRAGKPYLSLRLRSVPGRAQRAKAWRRLAWRLHRGWPSGFPKDPVSRNLARAYRGSLHVWVIYLTLLVLLVLPFDVLAAKSNWQVVKPAAHGGTRGDDTAHPGPGTAENAASATSGFTSPQPPQQSTNKTGRPDTTDSAISYLPPNTAVATPKPANPQLSRTDLTVAFGSIAPAGQERTHKQQVCEQLTAEQEPASDLGPSPQQICTDSNLQTYATY